MTTLTNAEALVLIEYIRDTEETISGEWGQGLRYDQLAEEGEVAPEIARLLSKLEEGDKDDDTD